MQVFHKEEKRHAKEKCLRNQLGYWTVLIFLLILPLLLFWSGPVNLIADENPDPQATRLLAGLSSDMVTGGSLQDGPWSGKLHLPLIHKNFNPALFAVVPNFLNLTRPLPKPPSWRPSFNSGTVTPRDQPHGPGRQRGGTGGSGSILYFLQNPHTLLTAAG